MGCCGDKQKRPTKNAPGYISVRWSGDGPTKVRGGASGRMYRFDGYGSVVAIDERDLGAVQAILGMTVV